MTTRLSLTERFARLATVRLVIALAIAAGAFLLGRAPLVVAIGAAFALPIVIAGLVFGSRYLMAALRGSKRLPTPPRRPGSMHTRPYSQAQRRRPRT